MSVSKYETAKGTRWCVSYTKEDGSRTRKRGFLSKSAARAWETRRGSEILSGEWVEASGGNVTVGELGDAWLARQSHLKPSSLRSLRNVWEAKVKPYWGGRSIGSVGRTGVVVWLAGFGMNDGWSLGVILRGCARQILNSIFRDAVRGRRVSFDPVEGVPMSKKTRAAKTYLTHEQLQSFAACCGVYETLVLVIGYCGLRWGEAIVLTTDDVGLLRGRIIFSKNVVWFDGKVRLGTPKGSVERSVLLIGVVAEKLGFICVGWSLVG